MISSWKICLIETAVLLALAIALLVFLPSCCNQPPAQPSNTRIQPTIGVLDGPAGGFSFSGRMQCQK